MLPDNHPLPLPLDERERAHLISIRENQCTTALPGCERHEQLMHLLDRGFVTVVNCPNAAGTDQFELTPDGMEMLA